jgi:hypothetical protein
MKIPYLQVRNDCLLFYEQPAVRPPRNFKGFKSKAYSGKVTTGASKRIKKAIDILVQKSPPRMTYNPITFKTFPFKLNFITLTFSCAKFIDGDEGYEKCMKPLLRKLRKLGQFSYVWKAEFQQDTDYHGNKKKHGGQLHYHIASNRFVPWTTVRKEWNNLQRKAGYLKQYGLKHGHYNPNSIDVHAVHQIRDLCAYLGKYMSKDSPKKLKGKVWDCSKDLKQDRFSFIVDSFSDTAIRQAVKAGTIKQIDLEHCTIFKTKTPLKYLSPTEIQRYKQWQQ